MEKDELDGEVMDLDADLEGDELDHEKEGVEEEEESF